MKLSLILTLAMTLAHFHPCSLLPTSAPGLDGAPETPSRTPDSPVEWLGETTVDTGDIPGHEDYVHVFEFTNLTEAPLVIDNVRASCGCTATEWDEAPTPPGETGRIKVNFDAAQAGYFRKSIKVFFNGHRGGHKLYLEGYVE